MTTDLEVIKTLWLDSRHSAATRKTYRNIIRQFEEEHDLATAKRIDVTAYKVQLEKAGKTPSTVNTHLAALNSFYKFAIRNEVMTANPADVERPKVTPYGKALPLDANSCAAILAQIDRATLEGSRDFALLLGYMLTGLRNSAWRVARWSDFFQHGEHHFYIWSLKGKTDEKQYIAPPLWEALQEINYSGANASEFVFPQLTGSGRCLSEAKVNKILKHYAEMAGMDPAKVHIHRLRHSNAVMRLDAGEPLQDISKGLAHSSFAVTQIYLERIRYHIDPQWERVSTFLGVKS